MIGKQQYIVLCHSDYSISNNFKAETKHTRPQNIYIFKATLGR